MKEVILVGKGDSWKECPFDAETWGVLSCLTTPVLQNKRFDKVFAFDPPDKDIEAGLKEAKAKRIPVVSVYPYANEQYPTQEILDKIYPRGYLINTICHMIAMAIIKGYERIRLFGIDQYRGVYLLQKGAVEFWCGIAIGRGLKVEVAPSSMLISEYLKQVADVCGSGDDAQFTSLPEVLPFKYKMPVVPYPLQKNETLKTAKDVSKLYAFYDLEVAPATYDILIFLLLAEKCRIEKHIDEMKVVIVRGMDNYRLGDLEVYQRYGNYNRDYMEWRIKNILIPNCWLMPSCKGVMVVDRDEANMLAGVMDGFSYPEKYSVVNPVGRHLIGYLQSATGEMPTLEAHPQAKKYVRTWLKQRAGNHKVVTINLRETEYEPTRNSNLPEWQKFYRYLDKKKYYPLFVRDMEKSHIGFSYNSYPEIVWNVELRQALYELSYLNLSVNSGTDTGMLFDKKVNCIIFKWLTPDCGATCQEFFTKNGLKAGAQLKLLNSRQKIVWEQDTFEVIRKEFEEMVKKL